MDALTTAAHNALVLLRGIHGDMLARDRHCPTGCPCTGDLDGAPTSEACDVQDTIDQLSEALGETN